MERIKFAIIGAGAFSEHHAKTIISLKNAELVGFYSSSKQRAEKLAEKYHCFPFSDYNSLLKEVSAVVIVNKNNEHAKFAEKAMKKQKHIIIEKPFAITKKEMDTLLILSKKKNIKAISNLQLRYSGAYQKTKKILDSKKLGKILSVNLEIFQNKPLYGWKSKKVSGGGLLFMHLIHYLDILTFLFPETPKKIISFLRKKGEVEDTAAVVISYKDFDITINSSCSCEYDKQDKLEIIGEKSSLTVLDNRILIKNDKVNLSKKNRILRRLLGVLGISIKHVKYFKSPKLSLVYQNFINSIKNDNKSLTSLEKTKNSLNLIFEIQKNNILKK